MMRPDDVNEPKISQRSYLLSVSVTWPIKHWRECCKLKTRS